MSGADADLVRAAAVRQQRIWIKIINTCNNRCLFCLDSERHDGSVYDPERIRRQIVEGRAQGGERLILSGGEASIHPTFIELVRFGREAGYSWVQTISNGRRFAYPEFTKAAVEAGLSEVTLSIHGHTPELHDRLTGVPGSFVQALRGLRNLQRHPGVVISVDICLNRQNIRHLPAIMRFFVRLGVFEFDLLHIIPQGRAYPAHRDELFYDIRQESESLRQAFEFCASDPRIFLWTNRLPAHYLEGHERLIQDPKKLLDEVRGRSDMIADYLDGHSPAFHCRDEGRCELCFIRDLCDRMLAAIGRLRQRGFLRLHATTGWLVRQRAALTVLGLPATAVVEGPDDTLSAPVADEYRVDRLVVRTARLVQPPPRTLRSAELDLDDLPAADAWLPSGLEEVVVRARRGNLARLRETVRSLLGRERRVAVGLTVPADYADVLAVTPRVADVRRALGRALSARVAWRDLPPCLAPDPGPAEDPSPEAILFADYLDDSGAFDPSGFTTVYIERFYRAKSLRCEGCIHAAGCPGAPINYLRRFGFAELEPVVAGKSR